MTTPLVDVKCCFKFLPYINLVSFSKLSFDRLSVIHKKWFLLILCFFRNILTNPSLENSLQGFS